MSIRENIADIFGRIEAAKKRSALEERTVDLLLATKRVSAGKIIEAAESGVRVFGESYLQEAAQKIPLVDDWASKRAMVAEDRIRFHFIGALQRNKARLAVSLCDLIESVDRIALAREIDKHAAAIGKTQSILIQVNVSREENKSGVLPERARELCESIVGLKNLSLKGLMAIGRYYPPGSDESLHRDEFKLMQRLRAEIEEEFNLSLPVISMGMSEDFELAIEEGATEVRVGTAVFGERVYA